MLFQLTLEWSTSDTKQENSMLFLEPFFDASLMTMCIVSLRFVQRSKQTSIQFRRFVRTRVREKVRVFRFLDVVSLRANSWKNVKFYQGVNLTLVSMFNARMTFLSSSKDRTRYTDVILILRSIDSFMILR